jgi:hypothetical protein
LEVFDELVYFTRVFPHERLTLVVVLVDIEERRYPGRGKRRRRRRQGSEFQVEDQLLVEIAATHSIVAAADLWRFLPRRLPKEFHTAHLAQRLKAPRWVAQRIAYCLREMGAVEVVGKRGNAIVYQTKPQAA